MQLTKAPAFSFYAQDFMLGTVTLSLAERGAYITLLCYQWDLGSVPDDPAARMRILACSKRDAAAAWAGLAGKFHQGDDGNWRNDRLELERAKQVERRAALSLNGQKGGRPRNQTETNRFPKHKPNGNQNESLSSSSSFSVQDSTKQNLVPTARVEKALHDAKTTTSKLELTVSVLADTLEEGFRMRAGALLESYAVLFMKHCHGARYHNRMHLDFAKALELVRTWPDDARLEKLAVLVLTTDDDWIARTDRGFGVFAAKASWADKSLAAWEAEHGLQAH